MRDGGVYYGWRIVAVAFLTHCLTVGCVFYSFGVFFTPLIREFGWSRAELSWGFSSVSIFGAIYAPFVGRVVDRYGPRPSQLFGAAVLGCTLMLLASVHSLLQYYALMALCLSLGSSVARADREQHRRRRDGFSAGAVRRSVLRPPGSRWAASSSCRCRRR